MPKAVDHAQRRLQIAEAVWRIAASQGLEEVSMRQVAVEAGISTRLVQYYFGSRDQLLIEALALRNAQDRARIERKLPANAPAKKAVREILLGLMPTDDESRLSTLIQVAYLVRALGDAALLKEFKAGAGQTLESLVVTLLRTAEAERLVKPGLNLVHEAETLLSVSAGLASDLLLGLRTTRDATALIDYNLNRIFK